MSVKKILLYLFFFMAAFAVSLVVRFPEKKTVSYLSHALTKEDSNLKVSIGNIKPAWPFCFEFENIECHLDRDTVIRPDFFFVSPKLLRLFGDEKTVDIRTGLLGGTAIAGVDLKNLRPLIFSSARISLSGMKINDFKYITGLGSITLNCSLSGDINIKSEAENRFTGTGIIPLDQFSDSVKNPFLNTLNIQTLDFSIVQFDFSCHENVITLKQFITRGPVINIALQGTIHVMFPIRGSRIDLSGSVLPDSPYLAKFANTKPVKEKGGNVAKDGIAFNIKGTLANPELGL